MTRRPTAASVLEQGRPPAGSPEFAPWFKDSDKLLAAVVTRARTDKAFAARTVNALAELAQGDPRLRKQLAAASMGGKRGPKGTPYWQHVMLVHDYELLRSQGKTYEAAIADLAPRFSIAESTMPRRLAKALAAVSDADRWWHYS